MGVRGLYLALLPSQVETLSSAKNDADLIEMINVLSEHEWGENTQETDSAWDAMHRCLTDGSLDAGKGEYPLNLVVLGGKSLLRQSPDQTAALVTPQQVADVSKALAVLQKEWFHKRYFSLLAPKGYDGPLDDTDFQCTWDWFTGVRDFYARAAQSGRVVIFTQWG